jgi:hypothetical protein
MLCHDDTVGVQLTVIAPGEPDTTAVQIPTHGRKPPDVDAARDV